MSKIKSIPLGSLPQIFDKCGFSEEEMCATLSMMLAYWARNDDASDITAEYIISEMDMEPFCVQTMISEGLHQLVEIARLVREQFLTGKLIRWSVFSYTILLELDE